jgi:hypothetical protein
MEVFILKRYLGVLFALEFTTIACYMLENGIIAISFAGRAFVPEAWITVAVFCIFLQCCFHEWMHVIAAEIEGVPVIRLVLEPGGAGYIKFMSNGDGREEGILFAGILWDLICYISMTMVMFGTNTLLSDIVGAAMIGVFIYGAQFPGSDWQMLRDIKTRKSVI